jgi:hypothetical protein
MLIILDYQQRNTHIGSKTTSDGSQELLQMTFSIVVTIPTLATVDVETRVKLGEEWRR